jgi:hypothetical protein
LSHGRSGHASLLALACACSVVTLPACDTRPTVTDTIVEFSAAVQDQALDQLFCLSTGAASAEELGTNEAERRANFENWAAAQYALYLDGRDAGQVELEPHGIQLVKLFALGRGTFSEFGPVLSLGAHTRQVRAELTFGYAQINLSRFSPGTTIYLAGAPAGTVHAVRVPRDAREIHVDALESVSVEWTVARSPARPGCPARWTVAAVEVVPGTERSGELTWMF